MAVQFTVEHTRTSEYLFAPKDIKFNHELNGRYELPDIEELIDSMVKQGQLQPILIRNDGGKPVLVAGFSRWRAAVEINKRKLIQDANGKIIEFKLRCVYVKTSEQGGFLCNISENLMRNATTPIDDGHNMARMERYGMSLEQIAEFYHPKDEFGVLLEGKPAIKWVEERMAYVSLSDESLKALKAGKVKLTAVQELAKLSQEQQKEALKSPKKITAASLKAGKDKKADKEKGKKPAPKAKSSKASSTSTSAASSNSDFGSKYLAVKTVISKAVEDGTMPGELDVSKMSPEDAVYAVFGVLLDMMYEPGERR